MLFDKYVNIAKTLN